MTGNRQNLLRLPAHVRNDGKRNFNIRIFSLVMMFTRQEAFTVQTKNNHSAESLFAGVRAAEKATIIVINLSMLFSASAAVIQFIQFAHLLYSLLALDGFYFALELLCEKHINYAHQLISIGSSFLPPLRLHIKARGRCKMCKQPFTNCNANIWPDI